MKRLLTVNFNYFRGHVGGNPTLSVEAESFEDLLNNINVLYPGIKDVILRGNNTIRNSISVNMYNSEGSYVSYVHEIAQKFPDDIKTVEIGLQDLGGG